MKPICPVCQSDQSVLTENDKFKGYYYQQCPCGVRFKPQDDAGSESWGFKVIIGERCYQLTFIKLLSDGMPDFSLLDEKKEILRLRFLPNITPSNAQEKVKTMLVFL